MLILKNHQKITLDSQGSVVVIGNFDGVHRGHRTLLETARKLAGSKGLVSVLTFEPHPRRLLRPDDPPFRLTPEPLKAQLLEKAGVDILFSLEFNWDFASQSAEDFARDVLINGIKPSHVVVGYDFRFGQMRKGDAATLKAAGLNVTVVNEVEDASSTAIREALQKGDVKKANEILGWEWEIWGKIVKGDQRGRDLGFPTANFPLGETLHPAYGIYAARVNIEGEKEWRAAAINIGIRPMFEIPLAQVESHILDFNRDIYGKLLKVKPVKFLRGEAKFANIDELVMQMKKDCDQARKILF